MRHGPEYSKREYGSRWAVGVPVMNDGKILAAKEHHDVAKRRLTGNGGGKTHWPAAGSSQRVGPRVVHTGRASLALD